jgi:ABC-type transport system involved in multi-copper enzyme maturation permease subunit
MLLTAPVRDGQVVLCKFLACLALYIVMWLPTILYWPVLLNVQFAWPGWNVGRILVTCGLIIPLGLAMVIFSMGFARRIGALIGVAGLVAMMVGLAMLKWRGEGFWTMTPTIDPMPLAATYLGLFAAGAMFLALGLWVSSLVRSQIVAALLALAINLVFILGGLLILGGYFSTPADFDDRGYQMLSFVSVPLHVSQDFARGIVDTRHLILYGTVTLATLFLTVRSLERRRWQ